MSLAVKASTFISSTGRKMKRLFVHAGQRAVLNDRRRFKVIVAGRRWGKSRTAATAIIKAAIKPRQIIWYVAPTYRMARDIMWREIKESIPKELIVKANETLMRLLLVNGTEIALKGADKPDTLRGVALDLVVIDEAQDVQSDAWYLVLRPTLSSTGGDAIIIGCVKNDTFVLPQDGMTQIDTFSKGSSDKTLDPMRKSFYGLDRRMHEADGFWNNGIVETRKLKTQNGFELESSLPHPVWVMGESGIPDWKDTRDLKVGDRMAIARGMEVWGDKDPSDGFADHIANLRPAGKLGPHFVALPDMSMNDDLAYFLGLWIAEGSFEEKIGRVTITCGDPGVGDFLTSGRVKGLRFTPVTGRSDQWRINSGDLIEYFRYIGMPLCKAPKKTIPVWVMSGKRAWAMNFLAGMFDGDGHCCQTAVRVGYSTASEKLAKGLQLLLSNFGVISRRTAVITEPTERVSVASLQHRVAITGANVRVFRDNVTLRIARKQMTLGGMSAPEWSRRDGAPFQRELLRAVRNSMRRRYQEAKLDAGVFGAVMQCNADLSYRTLKMFLDAHPDEGLPAWTALKKNLDDNYYWDELVEIEKSEAQTFDFTIPDTHSFWSNGFISHNTPKSFNWLYDVYMLGQRGDNYFDKDSGLWKINPWKSWQFPTITSPFIPPEEIEAARGDMDEKSFRQEFLASFESMSGRVYHAFDRKLHLGDYHFNPALPVWVGQDFNIDPMSAAIIQPQTNGELWIVDEIVLFGSNTQEAADELARRYHRQMSRITLYPDPAGQQRSHSRGESDLDILRDSGFKRIKFRRKAPLVADRINAVNRMLRSADGRVRLRIDRNCKHSITALEQVIYKPGTREVDKTMNIEHIADGIGYAIDLEFPVRKYEPIGYSH